MKVSVSAYCMIRCCGLRLVGAAVASAWLFSSRSMAEEIPMTTQPVAPADLVPMHATVQTLKSGGGWQEGALAATTGFYTPGDGGGALYRIQSAADLKPNGGDVLALAPGWVAVLLEREAVNYRMFGAVGDGETDDGVQIKLAHEYAGRHRIPVINHSGDFWIRETNGIPITTNVSWGHTVFHIDERYNDRRQARFYVNNDEPTRDLSGDPELKAALLKRVRPGVQLIPELAEYAGHLVTVRDSNDRIGIRAGYKNNKGWAREDFFYVEEEGRIIGDVAWEFKDFTSIQATPCNDNVLVIEGGGFHFSGDSPLTGGKGYYHHGIVIRRSRTIVREQWMGLEKGRADVSTEPRCGFYVLQGVYDVTLENIRCMPWIQRREDASTSVAHGTYGLGGARMLNCTFRNVTADAGWASWGVFGTNLNKNFRIEGCRLNRIDVHFHCWNLYIKDCVVGFKGISVTGGGELFVDNTTRHGTRFITFRPDYGSKWDGPIRIRRCTLVPTGNGGTSVLDHRMRDFDYKYPIGYARSVSIEDFTIDYRAAPESKAPCWLVNTAPFSKAKGVGPLFFPQSIEFRDIRVEGRDQGVRLIRIPDPTHFSLPRQGRCDETGFSANCSLVCSNVQLEKLTPAYPGDAANVHLLLGGSGTRSYADGLGLYPAVRFIDCEDVSLYLGNCAARATFERCSLNTVSTPGLRGELVFSDCHFRPVVADIPGEVYDLGSSLGTRFTNCTLHAPVTDGAIRPEWVSRSGILELNGAVRHSHLNTALGAGILAYCRDKGIDLTPDFLAKLKLHSPLDH